MTDGTGVYREPDFLPWDGRRVPMTLLGGYLGAGKTTLINEVLARTDRAVAVLVNDVGAVNVDAALIRRRSADMIEFTDGCVCCSISDGMGLALDRLREREHPPDQVVMELSGLAEPARVVPWSRSAGFRLDGVVIVVDGERLVDQLATPTLAVSIRSQIEAADLVVVSKADLVAPEALAAVRAAVGEIVPTVPVLAPGSSLAAAGILELGAAPRPRELPVTNLFDIHRVDAWPETEVSDRAELLDRLEGLGDDVVRVKGTVDVAGGGQLLVQRVGRRLEVTDVPAPERSDPTGLVIISLI